MSTTIMLATDLLWRAFCWTAPFLALLVVVVVVHEFGHFIVGRWFGAKVEAFSVGMGRELIGWTDRHGTRWRISAIPLGGYVRFAGDRNAASAAERRATLAGLPLPARAAIVAAGPIASLAVAVLILAAGAYIYGETLVAPRIDVVTVGSAAEIAGFKPGDVIRAIDGAAVSDFSDVVNIVSVRPDDALTIDVERDGAARRLIATPSAAVVDTPFGRQRVGRLGVSATPDPVALQTIYPSPLEALKIGAARSWLVVEQTCGYVARVVSGRADSRQLAGPIGIARMSHAAASFGPAALIELAALLSLSLGVMNLLPVPMLDGGHLLFYAIEAARGRALSRRAQEYALRAGLAFMLALAAFVTVNDLLRLFAA